MLRTIRVPFPRPGLTPLCPLAVEAEVWVVGGLHVLLGGRLGLLDGGPEMAPEHGVVRGAGAHGDGKQEGFETGARATWPRPTISTRETLNN